MGNPCRNRLKIDISEHSESDPILDRFLTPFQLNLGNILGAFGVPGGSLAPILAARSAPGPLPSGLLGSLRVLQSLQVKLFTDFTPTWSHIGGPGAHFEGPGAPF